MYAGGVSAGASFALKLPSDMRGELSGVVSEVMGLDPAVQTGYDVSQGWLTGCMLCGRLHARLPACSVCAPSCLEGWAQPPPPSPPAGAHATAASSQRPNTPPPPPSSSPTPLVASLVQWAAYPPTAFVMMQLDPPTNQKIQAQQAALAAAGVPSTIIPVPQRALYWPSFFSDQAADVSVDLSARTVTALQEVGGGAGGRSVGAGLGWAPTCETIPVTPFECATRADGCTGC